MLFFGMASMANSAEMFCSGRSEAVRLRKEFHFEDLDVQVIAGKALAHHIRVEDPEP
jgi:hypothetical protein